MNAAGLLLTNFRMFEVEVKHVDFLPTGRSREIRNTQRATDRSSQLVFEIERTNYPACKECSMLFGLFALI